MAKKTSIKSSYKQIQEDYKLEVQAVMKAISRSAIFEIDETIRESGVVLPATKWIIGTEYTIHTDLLIVKSIEADDIEVPYLNLNKTDHKKIIRACKQRKAYLLEQQKQHKK